MYIRFFVERNVTNLSKEEYVFIFMDNNIYLDGYIVWVRETNRHKFKRDKIYNRLCDRESNILEKDVLLTDEIKREVMSKFLDYMSKIRIIKWSERNK